jgi:hypothetical protein
MLEVGTKNHGRSRSSNQSNKQINKVPNEERYFGQKSWVEEEGGGM